MSNQGGNLTASSISESQNFKKNIVGLEQNDEKKLSANDVEIHESSDEVAGCSSLKEPIDAADAKRWRLAAIIVSWFSIVLTLAVVFPELVFSKRANSYAAFGLAFCAILDVLTSAVVLWRYYYPDDIFSQRTEHISCIVLGVIFVLTSIAVIVKAILGLVYPVPLGVFAPGMKDILIISIVAACVGFILFLAKAVIAKQLSSWTMITDAVYTLMNVIIALCVIITEAVTKTYPNIWFLGSAVPLVVGVFLLFYGVWLTSNHGYNLRRLYNYTQTT